MKKIENCTKKKTISRKDIAKNSKNINLSKLLNNMSLEKRTVINAYPQSKQVLILNANSTSILLEQGLNLRRGR